MLGSAFYEVSCGHRGLRKLPGLVGSPVLAAGGGEIYLDEGYCGACTSLGQQDRRKGVAAQVRVAVFRQPGGDLCHLRTNLGNLQWYVRRRRKRRLYVTVLALCFDDAFVDRGVGLGKWRGPLP